MMVMISCKVCKIRDYRIIQFIDRQLELGVSYRKIAKDVIEKFKYPISYQSIRRHHLHIKEKTVAVKEKENNSVYGISTNPIRRNYYS